MPKCLKFLSDAAERAAGTIEPVREGDAAHEAFATRMVERGKCEIVELSDEELAKLLNPGEQPAPAEAATDVVVDESGEGKGETTGEQTGETGDTGDAPATGDGSSPTTGETGGKPDGEQADAATDEAKVEGEVKVEGEGEAASDTFEPTKASLADIGIPEKWHDELSGKRIKTYASARKYLAAHDGTFTGISGIGPVGDAEIIAAIEAFEKKNKIDVTAVTETE